MIDFFLEVGIPKSTCADILENIENTFGGKFDFDAFDYVKNELKDCKEIKEYGQEMIHSLYPDCLDKDMDDEDPRKNFLDASK